MIKIYNPLGQVSLTNDYFAALVAGALANCTGVRGMAVAGPKDGLKTMLFGQDIPEKGIIVRVEDDRLVLDLHVKVTYGVNISTIVDNIKERVSYAVENATNLKVKRINVCVDDIITAED